MNGSGLAVLGDFQRPHFRRINAPGSPPDVLGGITQGPGGLPDLLAKLLGLADVSGGAVSLPGRMDTLSGLIQFVDHPLVNVGGQVIQLSGLFHGVLKINADLITALHICSAPPLTGYPREARYCFVRRCAPPRHRCPPCSKDSWGTCPAASEARRSPSFRRRTPGGTGPRRFRPSSGWSVSHSFGVHRSRTAAPLLGR